MSENQKKRDRGQYHVVHQVSVTGSMSVSKFANKTELMSGVSKMDRSTIVGIFKGRHVKIQTTETFKID